MIIQKHQSKLRPRSILENADLLGVPGVQRDVTALDVVLQLVLDPASLVGDGDGSGAQQQLHEGLVEGWGWRGQDR